MSKTACKRAPGRPKSEAKRGAILTAARDLLLEHGFSQTSMEMIAAAAGVGKPTVYSHFGSKEELFEAIIAARRQTLVEKIGGLAAPTDDPRDDLEQFAMHFQRFVLKPSARRWDRLVIAEAGRHPKLAQTLFRAGPAHVLTLLQTFIESQAAAGRLRAADASIAAEHMLGLLTGFELLRGQMASQPKRTEEHRLRRAKAAVSVFMAAYGVTSERNEP